MKLLYTLVALVTALLVNALIVMACWNYVAPDVLGVKPLTFLQALVLATLIRSLNGADIVKYKGES